MRFDDYLAFAVIGISPLLFFWAYWIYSRPGEEVFAKVYRGVKYRCDPGPGLVNVKFCTYRGVLAWVTITEHDFYASPVAARVLLKRLFWFNIKYGLFAAGGLFVPFLSLSRYHSQSQSIDRQEVDLLFADGIDPDESLDDEVEVLDDF